MGNFDNWLRSDTDRDDHIWVISLAQLENMHDIVTVTGNGIKMNFDPENRVRVRIRVAVSDLLVT